LHINEIPQIMNVPRAPARFFATFDTHVLYKPSAIFANFSLDFRFMFVYNSDQPQANG